ncbi:hypothetical protein P43SY_005515 [Pythium insidiosum]|uniref:Transmembrane protein n=1 Tax=Pythium insidiosum TaxID=114742 RepID=A0AAD5MFJ6_PYTIN|nr:hypothetical protein P43SY_005515 [Pythium insidiosum]
MARSFRLPTERKKAMPPRGAALVPLLTLLGSAAAAAVLARRYVPQYMAAKHRRERMRQETDREEAPTERAFRPNSTKPAVNNRNKDHDENGAIDDADAPLSPSLPLPLPPHQSSLVVAMLLQDGFLLLAAFGVGVMALAVLVSLALVVARDELESPAELQMFAPMMLVAMGLISVGVVSSMLRGKPRSRRQPSRDDDAAASRRSTKRDSAAMDDDSDAPSPRADEQATQRTATRASRCPFGFG